MRAVLAYYEWKDIQGKWTSNDYTVVYVDNDRDIGSEMAIKLVGLHDLTASDFIL